MPLGTDSLLLTFYMLLTALVPLAVVGLVVYYASRAGTRRALSGFQLGENPDRRSASPPPHPAKDQEKP